MNTQAHTRTEALEEYKALWHEHGIEEIRLPENNLHKRVKNLKHHKVGRPADTAPTLSTLEDVVSWIGDCKRCGLCGDRTQLVVGTGNPKAQLLFIGEGPGKEEDTQGLPFVGQAGELLNKIIAAMHLTREQVYITNIVKCRPPENRVPSSEEINSCLPFLKAQIELIQPKMIVALGLTAASTLTNQQSTMSLLRGRFHTLAWNPDLPLMATYHPAYLLRNPAAKKIVWEDMKLVIKRLKLF